ncbi:hypothetical protein Esti_002102 [Eimeria stiedai]
MKPNGNPGERSTPGASSSSNSASSNTSCSVYASSSSSTSSSYASSSNSGGSSSTGSYCRSSDSRKCTKWCGVNACADIASFLLNEVAHVAKEGWLSGAAHEAWATCSKLAEPGTEIGELVRYLVAAALEQQHKQQQQLLSQHLELCVGIGWVAACARDLAGSFDALGLDGRLRLFQICDPEGTLPLREPLGCYRLLFDWGLHRPGVPTHDVCSRFAWSPRGLRLWSVVHRAWVDAQGSQQREHTSSVALLAAACTLVSVLLLEVFQ